MKDRKIPTKNSAKTAVVSKDIREHLELDRQGHGSETANARLHLVRNYADEFHQLYVQPLLESGRTVEGSLAMLAINRLSEPAIERAKVPTVTHTSLYWTSESSPALGESKWF